MAIKNPKNNKAKRSSEPKQPNIVQRAITRLERQDRYAEADQIWNAVIQSGFLSGNPLHTQKHAAGRAVRLAKRAIGK